MLAMKRCVRPSGLGKRSGKSGAGITSVVCRDEDALLQAVGPTRHGAHLRSSENRVQSPRRNPQSLLTNRNAQYRPDCIELPSKTSAMTDNSYATKPPRGIPSRFITVENRSSGSAMRRLPILAESRPSPNHPNAVFGGSFENARKQTSYRYRRSVST